LNAIPYIKLKKGIEPISNPVLIIKSERLRVLALGIVSIDSGFLNQDEIFINNHRKNLTKSSKRTKRARIIFDGMRIIRRAKLYVLKYMFQLCQSENRVKTINKKQKNEISQ
jgi:hypothetical protein